MNHEQHSLSAHAEQKPHESGLTCIHRQVGLCLPCRLEYEEDPLAWMEYGSHPQGIANWNALQQEFLDTTEAAQDPTPPDAWDGIPF